MERLIYESEIHTKKYCNIKGILLWLDFLSGCATAIIGPISLQIGPGQ
jgi:hypothetical protein